MITPDRRDAWPTIGPGCDDVAYQILLRDGARPGSRHGRLRCAGADRVAARRHRRARVPGGVRAGAGDGRGGRGRGAVRDRRQPALRRRPHRPHLAARRPGVRVRRAGRARHRAAARQARARRCSPCRATTPSATTSTRPSPATAWRAPCPRRAGSPRWRPRCARWRRAASLPTEPPAVQPTIHQWFAGGRRGETAARMAGAIAAGRAANHDTLAIGGEVLAQHRGEGGREVPRPADPRARRARRRPAAHHADGVPVVRRARAVT